MKLPSRFIHTRLVGTTHVAASRHGWLQWQMLMVDIRELFSLCVSTCLQVFAEVYKTAFWLLYPATGYKKCYNMAAFIPMKAAISFVFIIFAAEYNKKTYDGIYNR